MPGDRLLGDLRAATRPHHERIERLLGLDGPMALERYGAIIGGFHGFLAAWEPEVRRAMPERLHGWLDARGRAAFAAADLAFLGAPEKAGDEVPNCLPEASLPAAFGSLYVIEGSALGGQVITPWLKRDLGLEPGRGASYFHGHGERTGAMWRDFRQRAVAEVGDDDGRRRAACRAAERTFETLIRHFEPLVS
ncbi:biliverdin-producing heme oxygenase [Roseateles asaccharophilus]|uniref:Heme oxygenase n=1 Tax=Roseateles asaccharophilus TaxID=582607 RepID=A0ABU2ACK2_9BURK|nr:biliverdin-producing heme oxygenase [Roseateles asaccharophilus]MDR7334227.1 heme oxygenase [Roseateles asaccharophilus]